MILVGRCQSEVLLRLVSRCWCPWPLWQDRLCAFCTEKLHGAAWRCMALHGLANFPKFSCSHGLAEQPHFLLTWQPQGTLNGAGFVWYVRTPTYIPTYPNYAPTYIPIYRYLHTSMYHFKISGKPFSKFQVSVWHLEKQYCSVNH